MKEKIKKNYKILIAFILGGIIIGGLGTAYAVSIASSSVSYDNTSSGSSATTVKAALDELYSLANSKACLSGYYKVQVTTDSYKCAIIPAPVSFSSDDWDVIIANVQAGKTSAYTVGSTKTVDMGTLGTHTLRVANNSTPAECATEGFSQTACGFVLEFADIITDHRMNPYTYGDSNLDGSTVNGTGNKGGWEYSEMRTYVNNDIYNALPSALKSAIIETKVVSGHGTNDTTNFTTTDKLYLLSTHEVWEDNDPPIVWDDDEGNTSKGIAFYDKAYNNTRQLDYYKSQNVTTLSYSGAIKQNNGSNYWWLRSARAVNVNFFYYVGSDGDWYEDNSNETYGVAPAFRIA